MTLKMSVANELLFSRMFRTFPEIVAFAAMAAISAIACPVQAKRPITPADCVRTRRPVPGEMRLSPNGRMIAYIVKAPNLRTNKNDYLVYVRDVGRGAQRANGSEVFSSQDVSGLRWLSGSRKIAFLVREERKSSIMIVDAYRKTITSVITSPRRISSFSISGDGRVVAFSVNLPPLEPKAMEQRQLRGFAVKFGEPVETWQREDWWPDSSVYIVQQHSHRPLQKYRVCSDLISGSNDPCSLSGVSALSLSPDGAYLTFDCRPTRVPDSWKSNLVYKWFSQGGIPVDALAFYDLRKNEARIAFDAPDAGFEQPTVWSGDSRSFSLVSLAPIGSSWAKEDAEAGFTEALQLESHTHLFAVDVANGQVSKVFQTPPVWAQNPILFWERFSSPLLICKNNQTFAWMEREGESWVEASHFSPAFHDFSLRPSASSTGLTVASNGDVVVGVTETTMSPPEILKYDVSSPRAILLTDLNPEYRDIALGEVETIRWKNSSGADCSGFLIKPVGYVPGKRYPLVVMAKGWNDSFISDTSFQTAFPPQPLANAGFLILMANMPVGGRQTKTDPTGIDEASNWIAMIQSGISLFSERGMIDESNVGIMGFSRTSWLVDFMVTHSTFSFAAASSADSGLYNYGIYWYDNSKESMKSGEQEMGGPPYGKWLKNWISYSPAFNAQNSHVPLLMEYSGYGVLSAPVNAFEFFVALHRQGKPVELYFYPLGEHMLDTPFERVASLQRNVDWFRFWMQGYERPDAEDREQYSRWRALRVLQMTNGNQSRVTGASD